MRNDFQSRPASGFWFCVFRKIVQTGLRLGSSFAISAGYQSIFWAPVNNGRAEE